tara:strand:- start:1451 stop:3073 length:1623 start_codon:yes stop_codon:yes gene_type:complete
MNTFLYDDNADGRDIEAINWLKKSSSKKSGESSSDRVNKVREALIVFISNMGHDHPYLVNADWKFFYDQIIVIKTELIERYGEGIAQSVIFEQMGGQGYSFDFALKFLKEDGTQLKMMSLEYKHQARWDDIPQFYQPQATTFQFCKALPIFPEFFFKYSVTKQIELLNSIIDVVPPEITERYGSSIQPLNYEEWLKCMSRMDSPDLNDFDNVKFWKGISKNTNLFFRMGRHLIKCKCEGSYCNPSGVCTPEMMQKDVKFRRISKLGIHNFLCQFKEKVTAEDLLIIETKIRTKQGTNEMDSIGVGKGKTYMFIDKNFKWFLEPSPDTWEIDKTDITKIDVWGTSGTGNFVSNIDIPLLSGNTLLIKLRWQSVEGLFNPSLQCKGVLTPESRKFMLDNKFPQDAIDEIVVSGTKMVRSNCEMDTPSIEAPPRAASAAEKAIIAAAAKAEKAAAKAEKATIAAAAKAEKAKIAAAAKAEKAALVAAAKAEKAAAKEAAKTKKTGIGGKRKSKKSNTKTKSKSKSNVKTRRKTKRKTKRKTRK